jgi:hypothetical protein
LQQQEEEKLKRDKSREHHDASFAATLQSADEQAKKKRKRKEEEDMKTSKAGRAVLMVDKVIKIVEQLRDPSKTATVAATKSSRDIEPVGKDDAAYLAEKMLELQESFEKQGAPTQVCL